MELVNPLTVSINYNVNQRMSQGGNRYVTLMPRLVQPPMVPDGLQVVKTLLDFR